MTPLRVMFHGFNQPTPVTMGELVWRERRAWFQFSREFLDYGINPSPFSLEMTTQLQETPFSPFNGLHGLFNDSLPDGWGLYLMDKVFRQHGYSVDQVTPIDRLVYLGNRAMGALSFEPEGILVRHPNGDTELDITFVGDEATQLFQGSLVEVADHHANNGTSAAGARPKLLVAYDGKTVVEGAGDIPEGFTHGIVKFPTGQTPDQKSEGTVEWIYSGMAASAGISVMDSQLIPGSDGNAYFMTRRFDRSDNGRRHHVQSVSGLLNMDFRIPSFDYRELLKLSDILTRSHREKTELYRRMVFNVASGNRDDHTKNFAFMLTDDGEWVSTPAFDVSWNDGMEGEHTMTVNGKGRNVTLEDLLSIAKTASIPKKDAIATMNQVFDALSSWDSLAGLHEIPTDQQREISKFISRQRHILCPPTITTSTSSTKSRKSRDSR